MSINIDIQWLSSPKQRESVSDAMLRRWVKQALAPSVENASITLRIVGQTEGLALNSAYRKKDYATNVLTFDYSGAPDLAADIVICAPVVAKEARALGISLKAHYAHLVIHGLLHAQGWDHETSEADADEMEMTEGFLMLSLGLPQPYQEIVD
ncbi:MAG: rRNA maturation RNase YbeY [Brachymonas sp.]